METTITQVWTRARPTTTGAYWMREKDGGKKVVYVGYAPRGLYVAIGQKTYDLTGAAFEECDWHGPLAPPPD